jgi:hypothetical protein
LVVNTGDAFTFPSQTRHTFQNVDELEHARVLWIFTPALQINEPFASSHRTNDVSPSISRARPR